MIFERNIEPKKSMNIGLHHLVKKGERFISWCSKYDSFMEIFTVENEIWKGPNELRTIKIGICKSGEITTARENTDLPGKWIVTFEKWPSKEI